MYIRDMSYIFGIAVIIIRTIIKVIVDLSCEKKSILQVTEQLQLWSFEETMVHSQNIIVQ